MPKNNWMMRNEISLVLITVGVASIRANTNDDEVSEDPCFGTQTIINNNNATLEEVKAAVSVNFLPILICEVNTIFFNIHHIYQKQY